MTFTEALAVLKKDEEEERNWRSARSKLAEVLATAIEAQTLLQQIVTQRAELTTLSNSQAALQRSIRDVEAQLSGYEADLAVKEQRAQNRLGLLDTQIKAKEQRLADVEAKLDALKTHLTA